MELHTADELLQAYAPGERKFSYWKLSGADLHNADLSGANLSGAFYQDAKLHGTTPSSASQSSGVWGRYRGAILDQLRE